MLTKRISQVDRRLWVRYSVTKWNLGIEGCGFDKKNVFRRRKNRILPLRFDSPSASTEVVHRPRSQSPLHFDTYSKFARKINFLVLGVYCPAGQSAFRRSRPQLKLGEEIDSSRLVDDNACSNQRYQTPT